MDPRTRVEVLRRRSELSALVLECADLALDCVEPSPLGQYRYEGTRCVLVWIGAKLGALFPFGAPARYRGLPMPALSAPAPLLRKGCARASVHALLDWFRADGEGAALLEIRGVRVGGAVYRAFADVADERDQLVLRRNEEGSRCTLLLGDGAWDELTLSALPLSRWAKLGAARLVYI